MQQRNLKSFYICHLLIICSVVALVAAGCRDNPQDRAVKEVREQVRSALAETDKAAASQQIQSALAAHRPGGLTQDSANLVAANLTLNQGLSLQAERTRMVRPIQRTVDAISGQLNRSQKLLLEQERTAGILATQDSEIEEFRLLLAGTEDASGLEARLEQARQHVNDLQSQRNTLAGELNAIQTVIDDTQARSEELLRQADLQEGQDKFELQKQAYELLLERKDDHVQLQDVENQIRVLDDRIALAESRVETLAEHVRHAEDELEALVTAESRQLLNTQIAEIDETLAGHRNRINTYAETVAAELEAYREMGREVLAFFDQAADKYRQVRPAGSPIAAIRLADTLAYAARAFEEQVRFEHTLGLRLADIIDKADESLVDGLRQRVALRTDVDQQQLASIIDLFEQADQAYEAAMSQARRLADRGSEAAADVLLNRLLSLYHKMRLADAVGQYDLASEIHNRIDQLREEGAPFGDRFTRSEVVRLIDQGLDFAPALPVNVELYFEGIRQEFTAWRQLQDPDQQAEAVEQNLAQMDELVDTYGEQMEELLAPLRREMLEARQRGFEPQPGAPVGVADPNAL